MRNLTPKTLFQTLLVLALFLVVPACDMGQPFVAEEEHVEQSDPLIAYLIRSGFNPEMIEDYGDYFIVEGDIRMEKDLVAKNLELSRQQGNVDPSKAAQAYSALVSWSNVGSIEVYIDGTLNGTAWVAGVRSALSYWNGVYAKVKFTEIFIKDDADIVAQAFDPGDECNAGLGGSPSGGQPYHMIELNPDYDTSCDEGSNHYRNIAAHELGHTIGFHHTNSFSSNIVTTPDNDAASLMNSASVNTLAGFSFYDKIASQTLYPKNLTAYIMTVDPPQGGSDAIIWGTHGGSGYPTFAYIQKKSGSSWIKDTNWDCPIVFGNTTPECTTSSYYYTSGQEVRLMLQNTNKDVTAYSSSTILP